MRRDRRDFLAGLVAVSAPRRGSSVVVSFRDVTGALTLRGAGPSGVELCGATQASCRWADARVDVSSGSSVALADATATRVRNAWGGSPLCPLVDCSVLPAGPFKMTIRSDATAQ